MQRDMKAWRQALLEAPHKKPMPVLSFPAVQLMGITVKDLISSSDHQAKAMALIAQHTDASASVSLMDLSVEAEAFGATIRVSDDEVPTVTGMLVHDEDEAAALAVPQVGAARTGLYVEAIRKACDLITDRPVLAGMIGPYSLAARLRDVSEIMMDSYDDPDMVHVLLQKSTEFLISYAKAYKEAGANGVVIAEPVAGLLSPDLAAEFSAPYVKKIVDAVQDDSFLVIYHNCGGAVVAQLPSILSIGAAAYHFGNAIDMLDVLQKVPDDTICMGNIDPAGEFRGGTPDSMREATLSLLKKCSGYKNFVLSSGCDIPPLSKWENIDAFFAAAQEYAAQ